MNFDPFSRCHPAVNFVFFLAVIGFGVVIQHPAYALAALVGSGLYYLLLHGKSGLRFLRAMAGMLVLIAVLNPLINDQGEHILFSLWGRPYTLEAMAYGGALGLIFSVTMIWFGCYSQVLTSDKFTALFGNLIPARPEAPLARALTMPPPGKRRSKAASACFRH